MNHLEEIMLGDYLSVNENRNPFVSNSTSLTSQELEFFLRQYSLFPKNIISFFITAIYNLSYHNFTEVSDELIRNLSEELGKDTTQDNKDRENFIYKPHYAFLREGIMGLDIDIKDTLIKKITQDFLDSMRQLMDDDNPSRVCGSAYALETSATPELKIVLSLVQNLFELQHVPMSQKLEHFFMSHINEIETGHEERLKAACLNYVTTSEDLKNFEQGFRAVMATMDHWWKGLYDLAKLEGNYTT